MKLRPDQNITELLLALTGDVSLLSEESSKSIISNEEIKSIWGIEREPLIQHLISFRKHQQGDRSWRRNKWSTLMGIKKWHRSMQGKAAHRKLGTWIASKIAHDKHGHSVYKRDESIDIYEGLAALSSLRTHLYIEAQYLSSSLQESVEIRTLVEYAAPVLLILEQRFLEDTQTKLTEDEMELLLRLCEPTALLRACSEVWSIPYNTLNTLYSQEIEQQKQHESFFSEFFLSHIYIRLCESTV